MIGGSSTAMEPELEVAGAPSKDRTSTPELRVADAATGGAGVAAAGVPRMVEDDRATEEDVPGWLVGWQAGRMGAEGTDDWLRMYASTSQ
jgi:hypothetical protein